VEGRGFAYISLGEGGGWSPLQNSKKLGLLYLLSSMTLPYEEDLVCEALPVGRFQFFNQEFGTPGKKN
jgi:hypothetical protein